MKKMKLAYVFLLAISLVSFSTLTIGSEVKRVWQTSACFTFDLAVRDKMVGGAFVAKYIVKSANGNTFISEKKADDFESSRVIFPDDFYDERTKLKAWIICSVMTYQWFIYADNKLTNKGTITFETEGIKK